MHAQECIRSFNCDQIYKHYGAVLFSSALVVCLVELPFFQQFLFTTGLSIVEWEMVIGLCSTIFIAEEVRKFIFRRQLTVKN